MELVGDSSERRAQVLAPVQLEVAPATLIGEDAERDIGGNVFSVGLRANLNRACDQRPQQIGIEDRKNTLHDGGHALEPLADAVKRHAQLECGAGRGERVVDVVEAR